MPGNPVAPSTEVGFEVVRRGYDQGEVDTHLRTLDAHISILVADRNAALEQAGQLARELDESRVRAEKLRAQVRTLVSPGQNVQGMSERMRAMLRLAQDEVTEMLSGAATEVTRRITESEGQATQIVAAAKAEAESTLNAARTEAETTLTAARTEADTTLNAARTEADTTLNAARTEAETTVSAAKADAGATLGAATAESERLTQELARARAEFDVERRTSQEQLAAERREVEQMLASELEKAEQERARAWAESETRRTVAEEDFTLALDQRRSEALAAIAAERTEAHRQSEELRELAAQRFREEEARAKEMGRAVVGDAEQRFGELIELRKRISEQLSDARVVLDRTLEKMTATPERTSAEPAKSDSRALPSQREFAAGGALATGEAGSGDADETDTQTNGSRRPRPRPRPQAAAGRR